MSADSWYQPGAREAHQYLRPYPLQTALTPVKMAKTRFESGDGMLQTFLRSQVVYKRPVSFPDFARNLFGSRNTERRTSFKSPLADDTIYDRCLGIYHKLKVVGKYHRFFNNEESLISEVLPLMVQLRRQLGELSITPCSLQERKVEVMKIFKCHVVCSGRRISLLTPLHLSPTPWTFAVRVRKYQIITFII